MNLETLTGIFKKCKNLRDLFAVTDDLQSMGMQSPHLHGDEMSYLCPSHLEKQRSFYINMENGEFFCQACKFKGWIGKLIHHLNPEVEAEDCYRLCSSLTGDNRESYIKRMVFKDRNYYISKARSAVVKGCSNRDKIHVTNIHEDVEFIRQFRSSIGGIISANEIRSSGLMVCDYEVDGFNQKRVGIVIPMGICPNPADDIGQDLFQIRQTHMDKMKYVNMSHLNFLGGTNLAIRRPGRTIVVVEGRFDEIRLRSKIGDLCNIVSAFSSHVSDEQWGVLMMLSDDVVISFDDDDAGHKAYDRIVKSNISKTCGIGIRPYFNSGIDWGSCPDEDFEKIRRFL